MALGEEGDENGGELGWGQQEVGEGGGRREGGKAEEGGAKSVHGQKAVHAGAVPVAENHSRSGYWFPPLADPPQLTRYDVISGGHMSIMSSVTSVWSAWFHPSASLTDHYYYYYDYISE